MYKQGRGRPTVVLNQSVLFVSFPVSIVTFLEGEWGGWVVRVKECWIKGVGGW